MNQTPTMSRQRGFTLVELLVVMTIIGILMAILVPAIYSARISALNAAITMEMNQLVGGIEEYKNTFGDYPPNLLDGTLVQRHLSKRQRLTTQQLNEFNRFSTNPAPAPLTATNPLPIDPAEALVFWLGGDFHPLPSGGNTNGSLHNNPVVPLQTGATRVGEPKTFFEFQTSRLIDRDGDGWLEYSAPGCGGAPYVYFESRSYNNYTTNPFGLPTVTNDSFDRGTTKPYTASSTTAPYQQQTKYQLICSGLDGLFGVGGQTFPDGPYPTNERDNLTNFSEGRTLQDSVP